MGSKGFICIDCGTTKSTRWHYALKYEPTSGRLCRNCYRKRYDDKAQFHRHTNITDDPFYHSKYAKVYNKIHREERNLKDREYREENKEKILKYQKEYYIENKEQIDAKHREYSVENKMVIAEHKKEYRRTLEGRYLIAKRQAKKRKVVWDLSVEQFSNLILQSCYYCGGPLPEFGCGLDRINNDKTIGYIIENVLPCCWPCNKMRSNILTVEEMKIAIKAVLAFRNKNLILSEVI